MLESLSLLSSALLMRYLRGKRWATTLLSAAYLLANLASSLPHSHSQGPGAEACHHGHTALGCREQQVDDDHAQRAPAWTSAEFAGPMTADDEDCTLCRAAGQRVLGAAPSQPAQLGDSSGDVAGVLPAQAAPAVARTVHSRAPPAVG